MCVYGTVASKYHKPNQKTYAKQTRSNSSAHTTSVAAGINANGGECSPIRGLRQQNPKSKRRGKTPCVSLDVCTRRTTSMVQCMLVDAMRQETRADSSVCVKCLFCFI